ncbi:hypothetical protein CHS0354_023923 [Potamilus streckersoni]|uniref:WYL domain-containing protein n=1 Tax=Potamilus streckersoni TaxID=2493646 RepID=A0AAE0RZL7_9BIVA|nr:hypothetical protein CHS0354_023923 [Potamilus streckersoni]
MIHIFTAIDFETATGVRTSICQVGIVRVENGRTVNTLSRLVQPPNNYYSDWCIDIHGITPDKTENAPTFDKTKLLNQKTMSKRGYFTRYGLIIEKLKNNPYTTFNELHDYVGRKLENLRLFDDDLQVGFSKRTLNRDIRDIKNSFGFEIEYSQKEKGYFIQKGERASAIFQRMMESFDVLHSLNLVNELTPFIQLENRKPQGTDNLFGLLHAVKNKCLVKFTYQSFWEGEPTERTAEPLALKEFRNRWYLIAKDRKEGRIKSFALDRLTNLDITKQPFTFPDAFKIDEHFRYCFGIIRPSDSEPENIILSFTPLQGMYVKTLPLHETQEVMIDNENECRIKLKFHVTHDFVMELLSLGSNVKVIEPRSLVKEIKIALRDAANQYE